MTRHAANPLTIPVKLPQMMLSNRSEAGQATVEFALVVGIVLVLFFAVIDFGRFVAMQAAVVTASREAARYGSSVGMDESDTWRRYVHCSGIRDAARRVTGSLVTLADADIDVWYDWDPLNDGTFADKASPCITNGSPADSAIGRFDRVVVKVTTTYEAISPIRFLVGPITVESTDRRTIVKPAPTPTP